MPPPNSLLLVSLVYLVDNLALVSFVDANFSRRSAGRNLDLADAQAHRALPRAAQFQELFSQTRDLLRIAVAGGGSFQFGGRFGHLGQAVITRLGGHATSQFGEHGN